MSEEIELEKCNFWNFRSPVTLTLDRVIQHNVVHQSSTSIYVPNFIQIGKTFCGRTYVRTYWRTNMPPLMLLGWLGGVDLITGETEHLLPNMNALVAIRKGTWTAKLYERILPVLSCIMAVKWLCVMWCVVLKDVKVSVSPLQLIMWSSLPSHLSDNLKIL